MSQALCQTLSTVFEAFSPFATSPLNEQGISAVSNPGPPLDYDFNTDPVAHASLHPVRVSGDGEEHLSTTRRGWHVERAYDTQLRDLPRVLPMIAYDLHGGPFRLILAYQDQNRTRPAGDPGKDQEAA